LRWPEQGNLGSFTLKSAGQPASTRWFDDGASLGVWPVAMRPMLSRFDMLFGPYGHSHRRDCIALTRIAAATCPRFNRKEAVHGGRRHHQRAPARQGADHRRRDRRAASLRESIGSSAARPAGLAIALDRQERGSGAYSAAQEVRRDYGIPCIAIAGLDDLVRYLETRTENPAQPIDLNAIKEYRERYGSQA
jgi:orotate phosphoribosyltransferase